MRTDHLMPIPTLNTSQIRLLIDVSAKRVRFLPGGAGAIIEYPTVTGGADIYTLGDLVSIAVGELVMADLVETELPDGGLCALTERGEAVLAYNLGATARGPANVGTHHADLKAAHAAGDPLDLGAHPANRYTITAVDLCDGTCPDPGGCVGIVTLTLDGRPDVTVDRCHVDSSYQLPTSPVAVPV